MSELDLAGILPPLTTPFDARGELDLAGLERNLEHYEKTGLAGYVAFGSSGEAVHLDPAERRRLLETIRRLAPGRVLVAGVNAQSARAALREVRVAAEAGADAALVITPYFYQAAMTQDALAAFYLELADATSLPLLLYNIPQNTGVTLAPATLARIAAHERVVGLKDSSGNFDALLETLRLAPPGFAVFVGHAGILYPALACGAAGGVLAVAGLAPEACVELFRAVRNGNVERARDLQERLAPVSRAITAELGIAGLKTALDLVGLRGGAPRSPLRPLGSESRERLCVLLHESGLFPALRR